MGFLKTIWEWLLGVEHKAVVFFIPMIDSLEKAGGQVLRDAVVKEVAAAEEAGVSAVLSGKIMSGAEKFVQAQTEIIVTLKTKGIPIIVNAINGAIEAQVASLRDTSNVAIVSSNSGG